MRRQDLAVGLHFARQWEGPRHLTSPRDVLQHSAIPCAPERGPMALWVIPVDRRAHSALLWRGGASPAPVPPQGCQAEGNHSCGRMRGAAGTGGAGRELFHAFAFLASCCIAGSSDCFCQKIHCSLCPFPLLCCSHSSILLCWEGISVTLPLVLMFISSLFPFACPGCGFSRGLGTDGSL